MKRELPYRGKKMLKAVAVYAAITFFKHFKTPFGLNIPNTGFADFSRPDETSSFT